MTPSPFRPALYATSKITVISMRFSEALNPLLVLSPRQTQLLLAYTAFWRVYPDQTPPSFREVSVMIEGRRNLSWTNAWLALTSKGLLDIKARPTERTIKACEDLGLIPKITVISCRKSP